MATIPAARRGWSSAGRAPIRCRPRRSAGWVRSERWPRPRTGRWRMPAAVTRDFIDAEGVRRALRSAGLHFNDGLPDQADLSRLVHVFAKSVIPGSDQIRGQRITLLDDADAYQIGKALGGMLVASVTGRTTNYVSGGERNSHQGPPGGNIVAAVVRAET